MIAAAAPMLARCGWSSTTHSGDVAAAGRDTHAGAAVTIEAIASRSSAAVIRVFITNWRC